ncbi:MAG: AI-2E family transporter [Anaerolineaceae bacterium]|nr:AI-2E family transporter [Anaerolineaceae bacterium]
MKEKITGNPWSIQTKTVVISTILVLMGYALFRFWEIIAPMVLAIILAYVLTPAVNWLQAKTKMPRALAILLLYLVITFLIYAILSTAIPMLITQMSNLDLGLNETMEQASGWFGNRYEFAGFVIDGQELLNRAVDALQGVFEPIIGQTLDIVAVIFSMLIWIIFIVIISFYMIKDSDKIVNWFRHLVPDNYREDFEYLLNEIHQIWSAFFRGQIILVLLVMVIISAVGLIIGLKFALVLGIIAGLLEFFPSIGHMVWLILASAVAFFGGSTWLAIPNWAFLILVFVVYILFTQFDLNYLIPKIIGRSVNLPPMVVIMGIVVGATTAGVLGVVLAAPTIASLRVIGRYVYAHLVEIEPFSEKPASQPMPEPQLRWWHGKFKYGRRNKPTNNED